MKLVAIKKITSHEFGKLLNDATSVVASLKTSVNDAGVISIIGRYTDYQCVVSEDGSCVLSGRSTSGTYHELKIMHDSVTVVHDGNRGSFPGLLSDMILKNKEFFQSENGWKITEYSTSVPSWAPCAGWLLGKFGSTAPATAEEAWEQELERINDTLDRVSEITGVPVPLHLVGGGISDTEDAEIVIDEFKSKLTDVHYRRLAAMGIDFWWL